MASNAIVVEVAQFDSVVCNKFDNLVNWNAHLISHTNIVISYCVRLITYVTACNMTYNYDTDNVTFSLEQYILTNDQSLILIIYGHRWFINIIIFHLSLWYYRPLIRCGMILYKLYCLFPSFIIMVTTYLTFIGHYTVIILHLTMIELICLQLHNWSPVHL